MLIFFFIGVSGPSASVFVDPPGVGRRPCKWQEDKCERGEGREYSIESVKRRFKSSHCAKKLEQMRSRRKGKWTTGLLHK